VAAGVAVRLRHRRLLWLHAVVGTGVVLAVVDVSRILGVVWYYLLLWIWAIAALMAVATVWTAIEVVRRRRPPAPCADGRLARFGLVAHFVLTAVSSGRLAFDAPNARHSDPEVSDVLRDLLPDTIAALDAGVGAAPGRDGRYLVNWADAYHIGSQGYGLLNELERAGFDAGGSDGLAVIVTPHRVVLPSQADAQVTLATGIWVERWRAVPGAEQVAFVDPRTDAQRARFVELRAEVVAELQRLGLDDLVPRVDDNLFGAAVDRRVPEALAGRMQAMLRLGVPTAVFVSPPGSQP
jgi:hypothetical protein